MPVEKISYSDPLRVGTDKINKSIEQANKSEKDAAAALARSLTSEQIALLSKAMSESTQQQLDTIIIESGTSDAEVIQARGGQPLLKDRLNGVDAQLVEKVGRQELTVNALDYGIVPDGVKDNTLALQSLLDQADGKTIFFPAGIYKINGEVNTASAVHLKSDGDASVLDFSGGGNLLFSSPLQPIPKLNANIIAGRNTATFVASHTLLKGDVFIAHNPTDYSWAPFRPYYHDGCMFRVDQVTNANSVKVFGVSPDTYEFGAMNLYKLTGNGVTIDGFQLIPNPVKNVFIWIDGHQKVRIKDVTNREGGAYTGIEIWRCFDVDVANANAEIFNGDSYPVTISNSQKVTLSRCSLYSSRHSLALGGRAGDGCVPTRDVLVEQCHLFNRSDSGIGASDIHGNCENITYSNCYMNTGANMAGKNVKYIGCTIVGRNPDAFSDGNCVYGSEVVAGVFSLENCRLITYGNGASVGAGLHLDVSRRIGKVSVQVKNCILENRGNETTVRAVNIGVGASSDNTNKIDIEINGLDFISDVNVFAFLAISGKTDITRFASCIIDNVKAPGGQFLASSEPANYNMPMRLQRQSGSQSILAMGGSSFTLGELNTFRYNYPKQPHAFVSVGSEVPKVYNSNRVIYGGIQKVDKNGITPYIESGDATNWESIHSTNVMWSVGIEEI